MATRRSSRSVGAGSGTGGSPATVAVVGLGQAGGFAVEALGELTGVELVAGVDPEVTQAATRLMGPPIYPSIDDLPPSVDPDIVIVATPTPTHVAVCRRLLERQPAPRVILCEKPLATRAADARAAFDAAARAGVRLQVLYHFAFGAEVLWAYERWPIVQRAHGPVRSFTASFDDPKPNPGSAADTLVSSWADAGINAMSVLARFVTLEQLSRVGSGAPERCAATLRFRSAGRLDVGSITTNWAATSVSKVTEMRFGDGAALTLDHVARAATLEGDAALGGYSDVDDVTLALGRYRTMLKAYINEEPTVFGPDVSLALHTLLAEGYRRNRRSR